TSADGKLTQRTPFAPKLQDSGAFQEMAFPLHPKRTGRGVNLPEQKYNASPLRYGNGDPTSNDFDSLAEWFYDARNKDILIRIRWGKLLVTDPSNLRVFYGFDDAAIGKSVPSAGVAVAVLAVKGPAGGDWSALSVVGSFPGASGGSLGKTERFSWSKWDAV